MEQKITRDTFIAEDIVKIATAKSTMFAYKDSSSTTDIGVEEIPMPENIKNSGILPEGYAVDYHFDPATLVAGLAKQNITTVNQLSEDLFKELKDALNDPENVTLLPLRMYQEKQMLITEALAKKNDEKENNFKSTSKK